jgi:hypothetical protein
MGLVKGILLGSGAALLTVAGAQAADLPTRKAAPVEYVRICDAYGAGFFFIPGTQTCLRIGGYVRIEYDNRAEQTAGTTDFSPVSSSNGSHPGATSGWYTRGTLIADARTPTPYGTVQAFIQARVVQSGSGTMHQDSASSIEAAYIRFAGFTFGQARQPYAFMSSWGYMSNWWTGWPNGVRQLSYTHVFGGGLSATVSVQDGNSNASGMGINDNAIAQSWDNNGPMFVGALNYDQSWGRLQAMGAWTREQPKIASIGGDGYAVGMGVAFNLPMLGRGDSIEFTATYWDGLAKLGVGNDNLSTPSSGSWGPVAPLPSLPITTSQGWSVGAQLQHYWTPQWRTVLFGAYADMDLNNGTTDTATATSAGAQLVWSPVSQFDIGVQALYVRAERKSATPSRNIDNDNVGMKLRVERRF